MVRDAPNKHLVRAVGHLRGHNAQSGGAERRGRRDARRNRRRVVVVRSPQPQGEPPQEQAVHGKCRDRLGESAELDKRKPLLQVEVHRHHRRAGRLGAARPLHRGREEAPNLRFGRVGGEVAHVQPPRVASCVVNRRAAAAAATDATTTDARSATAIPTNAGAAAAAVTAQA